MKKVLVFLLILNFNQSLFSQKFMARVMGNFDRDASITVIHKPSNTNITGLLENYLLFEGFNVSSESVSDKVETIRNKASVSSNGLNQKIELTKEKTILKSKYILETNFSEKWDAIWKVVTISVKVTDLNSGKVVAVATKKSRGMRNPDFIAEGIVTALVKEIDK